MERSSSDFLLASLVIWTNKVNSYQFMECIFLQLNLVHMHARSLKEAEKQSFDLFISHEFIPFLVFDTLFRMENVFSYILRQAVTLISTYSIREETLKLTSNLRQVRGEISDRTVGGT